MVSIKQLRYFDAVVRIGHFGRASEYCAVSQPALSMQVKNLENELGVQLLERQPQGVKPTKVGLEIAQRGMKILSDARDLRDFAHHRQNVLSGELHLGVIPSIAPYALPPLLPLLREKYPDANLHIRESQTEGLLRELQDGTLDVLLAALPIEQPNMETIRLFEDPFVLAAPADYDAKGRVTVTPDLLKDQRLLLLEEGHCLRDQALSFCQLQQIGNINTYGASTLSTIVQMVANGMGMTLLPKMSLALESRNQNVRLLRFSDPEPSRTVGLIWRSTSPRKRDFVEFGKLVVEAMR